MTQQHRMHRTARLLPALLVALVAFDGQVLPASAQDAGSQPLIPYAVSKRETHRFTNRETLPATAPVTYPGRGVLMVNGNGLSRATVWIVVDFDTRTIARVRTLTQTLPDGELEQILSSRWSRPLASYELNGVIAEANAVWDPTSLPKPTRPPTDARSNIMLLDGSSTLEVSGFGQPGSGLANVVAALLPPWPSR